MQKAFRFEVGKCTGCEACEVACSLENQVDPGISWRRIFTFNSRGIPGIESFHHSLACNHCVDPPCLNNCPANAYSKDPDTGAVTIDNGSCIGCKYCSWVCPFDAPRYNQASGLMEKCTFCAHRLEAGEKPACVEVCPTGALDFCDLTESGDPSDPSHREPGFVPSTAGPAIRFVDPPKPQTAPDNSADRHTGERVDEYELPEEVTKRLLLTGAPASRISLSSEWSLLVFTFVEALLVGVMFARLPFLAVTDFPGRVLVPLPVVAAASLLVMGLSALHLGRPGRAWRAVLNFRGSWLSREIVFFSLFVAVVAFMAIFGYTGAVVTGICVTLGAVLLFATDMLYHVTRAPGTVWHSAQTVLTAILIGGLFSGNVVVFGATCALKTFLYLLRKYGYHKRGQRSRPWLTRLRIVAGLAAPLFLWWYGSPDHYPYIVMLAVAGELIDRTEFYLELAIPSPAGQMAADLESAVKSA